MKTVSQLLCTLTTAASLFAATAWSATPPQFYEAQQSKTGGDQYFQIHDNAFATNVNGITAITWTADNDDGLSLIYLRLFNGDGTPRGDEIVVDNPPVGGYVHISSVAINQDQLALAWVYQPDGTDRTSSEVTLRTYDLDGNANSWYVAAGNGALPNVAMNEDGLIAMAWANLEGELAYRVYDKDAAPLKKGPEVHTSQSDVQAVKIAVSSAGDIVIAWTDINGEDTNARQVILAADGAIAEFGLNSSPRVERWAIDTTINGPTLVTTWIEDNNILAWSINLENGSAIPTLVAANVPDDTRISIGANQSGEYKVAWADTEAGRIDIESVDWQGNPSGNPILLTFTDTPAVVWMTLEANGKDGFKIAWNDLLKSDDTYRLGLYEEFPETALGNPIP